MLRTFRATIRFGLSIALLPVFAALILVTALIPIRVRGVRLAGWATSGTAKLGLRLLGVRVEPDPELREFSGIYLPNHISFIDILVMLSLRPVGFLASIGVRDMPIIGTVAAAIGTQFVDRSDQESRDRSRAALAQMPRAQSLVIFPEGGIPPADEIWPVRHGALEVAEESDRDALVVGLVYDQPGARWCAESLWSAMFRVQSMPSPLVAKVIRGPEFSAAQLRQVGVAAAADLTRAFYRDVTGFPFGAPLKEHLIEPID